MTNLPAVDLGSNRTVLQVAAGNRHTCTVLDDATVKCWGAGFDGQLGYGDNENRGLVPEEMGDGLPAVDLGTNRTAKQIATGLDYTCAVLDNDNIKCWGNAFSGRLGYGDFRKRGDDEGEMANALPAVDLGDNRTAIQVTLGYSHTCALLDDATVKCWGPAPMIGYGDTHIRGDEGGEMGDDLPIVDLGTNRTALQVEAGDSHTCAVLDDATVKCWGLGSLGRLGYGNSFNIGSGDDEMGNDLLAVNVGENRTVVQVDAGLLHTCAILDDASVKCWGRNAAGQLGYGDTNRRGDGAGQMGDVLLPVDLGSNITEAPTAPLSQIPSTSPTFTPSTNPTHSPSMSPTLSPSRIPTTPKPTLSPIVPTGPDLTDPAVVGGISAGVIIVLAAGCYQLPSLHTKGKLKFAQSGAATAEVEVKA